jgi:hypothetical protein
MIPIGLQARQILIIQDVENCFQWVIRYITKTVKENQIQQQNNSNGWGRLQSLIMINM